MGLLALVLWKWLIWILVMRDFSKMNLQLDPTDGDLTAGLGFLGEIPKAFSPVLLAISVVIGAAWRTELQAGQIDLKSLSARRRSRPGPYPDFPRAARTSQSLAHERKAQGLESIRCPATSSLAGISQKMGRRTKRTCPGIARQSRLQFPGRYLFQLQKRRRHEGISLPKKRCRKPPHRPGNPHVAGHHHNDPPQTAPERPAGSPPLIVFI
jgi:hypothetical protein